MTEESSNPKADLETSISKVPQGSTAESADKTVDTVENQLPQEVVIIRFRYLYGSEIARSPDDLVISNGEVQITGNHGNKVTDWGKNTIDSYGWPVVHADMESQGLTFPVFKQRCADEYDMDDCIVTEIMNDDLEHAPVPMIAVEKPSIETKMPCDGEPRYVPGSKIEFFKKSEGYGKVRALWREMCLNSKDYATLKAVLKNKRIVAQKLFGPVKKSPKTNQETD